MKKVTLFIDHSVHIYTHTEWPTYLQDCSVTSVSADLVWWCDGDADTLTYLPTDDATLEISCWSSSSVWSIRSPCHHKPLVYKFNDNINNHLHHTVCFLLHTYGHVNLTDIWLINLSALNNNGWLHVCHSNHYLNSYHIQHL